MKLPLKEFHFPQKDQPGYFGAIRKHDIHTGIDLYTTEGAAVYAMEDGEVIRVDCFTGSKIGFDWWNETFAVMIEGKSGVINYGEIEPNCKVGDKIKEGDKIGHVIRVLPPEKLRIDIPNHSCSMLHIELYEGSYREFAIWELNATRPIGLLDPIVLFEEYEYEIFLASLPEIHTPEEIQAHRDHVECQWENMKRLWDGKPQLKMSEFLIFRDKNWL